MHGRKLNNVRGFSLFEAMIAATVVVIGILGLTKLQSRFLTSSHHARVYTEAVNFAQSKIESLRNFATAAEFVALTGGEDSCDTGVSNSACVGLGVNLQRRWEINDCASGLNCKMITTEVSWNEAGTQRKIHLISYLAHTQPILAGVLLAN